LLRSSFFGSTFLKCIIDRSEICAASNSFKKTYANSTEIKDAVNGLQQVRDEM
jgi:hypothetical protein